MNRTNLAACAFCVLFLLAEIGLYGAYRHHDGRFHWFLHFFIGASTALFAMSITSWCTRRPVRFPLLWVLAGHLLAMVPDFLFLWFSIIHQNWMDVFLWHIGAHFVPGRNFTWYVIFLLALATYLLVLRRRTVPGRASSRQERLLAGDTSRPLS